MRIRTSFALLAAFVLLASCTISPMPMDMTQAIQSAKTRADHDALAKHYDDAAQEMQSKADEHKKLLAQYQSSKPLYGKYAQDLINHCQGLVRAYEQATSENRAMAKSHREMAAEMK